MFQRYFVFVKVTMYTITALGPNLYLGKIPISEGFGVILTDWLHNFFIFFHDIYLFALRELKKCWSFEISHSFLSFRQNMLPINLHGDEYETQVLMLFIRSS